jgi:hypothetical protein
MPSVLEIGFSSTVEDLVETMIRLENLPELYLERSNLVLNQAKKFEMGPYSHNCSRAVSSGAQVSKASRFTYNADLRNTKTCSKRNATKVVGGTANSLAIKTLVVKLDRQRCTMVMVVTQLATTTAEYCMSCRI